MYLFWSTGNSDGFSVVLGCFSELCLTDFSVTTPTEQRGLQPEAQSLLVHMDHDRHLEKTNYRHLQLLRKTKSSVKMLILFPVLTNLSCVS